MKWILSKQLESRSLITDYEEKYDILFPNSFRKIVIEFNKGRPRPNIFDTRESKERVAKTLLSFNPSDSENIWEMTDLLRNRLPQNVYPFLMDQFGNFVCFDMNEEDPKINFFNLETEQLEDIANSFDQFVSSFYDI